MYAARVSINVVRLILTLMYWNETNCRVNQHMSHVAGVNIGVMYTRNSHVSSSLIGFKFNYFKKN